MTNFKYISWKNGKWSFWDKNKQENIPFELERFVVIDVYHTIDIWENEKHIAYSGSTNDLESGTIKVIPYDDYKGSVEYEGKIPHVLKEGVSKKTGSAYSFMTPNPKAIHEGARLFSLVYMMVLDGDEVSDNGQIYVLKASGSGWLQAKGNNSRTMYPAYEYVGASTSSFERQDGSKAEYKTAMYSWLNVSPSMDSTKLVNNGKKEVQDHYANTGEKKSGFGKAIDSHDETGLSDHDKQIEADSLPF